MRRRRTPEVIAGRVAPDGTAVADTYTSVLGATGVYSIQFPVNFRFISMTCMSHAVGYVAAITAFDFTKNAYQISIFNSGNGVAGNVPFSFVAVGYQQ